MVNVCVCMCTHVCTCVCVSLQSHTVLSLYLCSLYWKSLTLFGLRAYEVRYEGLGRWEVLGKTYRRMEEMDKQELEAQGD